MINFIYDLINHGAHKYPHNCALKYHSDTINYQQLDKAAIAFGSALVEHGLNKLGRVAIYTEKRFEHVIATFGTAYAGGVYVPINPMLKSEQVAYIIKDCNAHTLVTTQERLGQLSSVLGQCPDLKLIVTIGQEPPKNSNIKTVAWDSMQKEGSGKAHRIIDADMAAILYTSGSTGQPKGVVLSHRNIIAGAKSVAEYLELSSNDKILCVLPLSFDYGMNQITTMFLAGGTAVLMNYLFPRDIITLVEKEKITGLAAVPPLWIQLAGLPWAESITTHLRYITNSGGHMPKETLNALRKALPHTKPYLMYGLTESFRSTYLPPDMIDAKPDSMGKAIPNVEVFVVKSDGTLCKANEPGELVHRGPLVSLGYWNDPEKTAVRFKPVPNHNKALPLTEMAVWSGDIVRMDEEGYLYFVSRNDEMIKTSGYRVSPTEIEETVYGTHLVLEAAAFGLPHPVLGQAIALVVYAKDEGLSVDAIKEQCQKKLPSYMVPTLIEIMREPLPRNANGKIDRKKLSQQREKALL